MLNKKKKAPSIGRRLKVGFTSQGETLKTGALTQLLGLALGAGAAHVMKLGAVGFARHPKQALPALGEGGEAVAKRVRGEQGDQHGGLSVR
ncbi:MAG: hypothetical protein WAM83_24305, partial [Bradyrhizobium sp.]